MRKIIICGEKYSINFGEPLLFDCCKETIESNYAYKWGGDVIIECLDFYGRSCFPRQILTYKEYRTEVGPLGTVKNAKKMYHLLAKLLRRLKAKLPRYNERITIKAENEIRQRLGKVYDESFKNADLIIISGAGTLKYDVRLDFGPYYKIISEYAYKNNVPCVINAIGVESTYNDLDYRCSEFSKTLSSNSFRMISTRDNLIELKKYITNPKTEVFKVADPGIMAADIYRISKDNLSDVIGIGIIDYERFREFNRGISKRDYINTIIGIINNLDKKKQKWKLFTNGDVGDTICAYEIAEKITNNPSNLVIVPQTPKNLVETVGNFKGIITSRLHSCIVAYSLDVPFVAISWNNKISYFADNIGCPERVYEKNNLDSDLIVDGLNKALEEGFDRNRRCELNQSIEIAFKRYLSLLEE